MQLTPVLAGQMGLAPAPLLRRRGLDLVGVVLHVKVPHAQAGPSFCPLFLGWKLWLPYFWMNRAKVALFVAATSS